ncbi:hypothetical protein Trydic_g20512 [Trypoxylus dichotomus]
MDEDQRSVISPKIRLRSSVRMSSKANKTSSSDVENYLEFIHVRDSFPTLEISYLATRSTRRIYERTCSKRELLTQNQTYLTCSLCLEYGLSIEKQTIKLNVLEADRAAHFAVCLRAYTASVPPPSPTLAVSERPAYYNLNEVQIVGKHGWGTRGRTPCKNQNLHRHHYYQVAGLRKAFRGVLAGREGVTRGMVVLPVREVDKCSLPSRRQVKSGIKCRRKSHPIVFNGRDRGEEDLFVKHATI